MAEAIAIAEPVSGDRFELDRSLARPERVLAKPASDVYEVLA